jgi:hypothetical protein
VRSVVRELTAREQGGFAEAPERSSHTSLV